MDGDPQSLNRKGREALSAGDGPTALRLLLAAAAADPNQPAVLFNLSAAHRACGDIAAAIKALQDALALDPCFVQAMFQLGVLFDAAGDKASAVAVYRNFLDTAPEAVRADERFAVPISLAMKRVEEDNALLESQLQPLLAGSSPRLRESLRALLGRDRIYVSEPTFLTIPRLPAIPFIDRTLTPWIEALEASTEAIAGEARDSLLNRLDAFAPYVANPPGTPLNQWETLDHSCDWSALFFWKHGRFHADMAGYFPATASALQSVPLLDLEGRGPNAFFSNLQPGVRIPPHTGVTNARLTVHLPLVVPEGCWFRVGAETRQWEVGTAWVFDDTIEHEAWNGGLEARLILIFDIWHPLLDHHEVDALRQAFAIYDRHRGARGGTSEIF